MAVIFNNRHSHQLFHCFVTVHTMATFRVHSQFDVYICLSVITSTDCPHLLIKVHTLHLHCVYILSSFTVWHFTFISV